MGPTLVFYSPLVKHELFPIWGYYKYSGCEHLCAVLDHPRGVRSASGSAGVRLRVTDVWLPVAKEHLFKSYCQAHVLFSERSVPVFSPFSNRNVYFFIAFTELCTQSESVFFSDRGFASLFLLYLQGLLWSASLRTESWKVRPVTDALGERWAPLREGPTLGDGGLQCALSACQGKLGFSKRRSTHHSGI